MKKISSVILIFSICLNFIFANVQDENFNGEIINEQQIDYIDISTFSGINSKVSFQQLKEDIVDLKYLLSTCYAGFEEAISRGLDLEKFEQNILNYFSEEKYQLPNLISTDEISFAIYNELKNYFTDNHFSIYGANSSFALSPCKRILYSNIYVKQKGEKYFVIESDIPEIKIKSEYTGDKSNLFLYPAKKGKNIYRLGYFKTLESIKQENVEEKIQLSFDNKEFAVVVKEYKSLENKNWYFGQHETKDSIYFSASSFMNPPAFSAYKTYFEKNIKKYIELAKNYNHKKNIIIDLRSNTGGVANYSEEMLYKLYTGNYDEQIDINSDFFSKLENIYSQKFYVESPTLIKAEIELLKNYKIIEGEYINQQIEYFEKFVKNPVRYFVKKQNEKLSLGENKFKGNVIIISDRTSASASECTILTAKALFGKTNNFYLVGENSLGCYAYGGVYSYQGRNGSYMVTLSNTKNEFTFDDKKLELEGIGILPDYWSTNEDLLQTLISITGDKNLQKTLSGIETSLK